jgi:hypothetical protein
MLIWQILINITLRNGSLFDGGDRGCIVPPIDWDETLERIEAERRLAEGAYT